MKKIIYGLLIGITLGFVFPILAAPSRSGGTFNYSTGAGPVVAGGQTISSTWANTSLTDIQTGLTQSLSRYGDGGMEVPLQLVNGALGAPATKFASSTTTGIYYTAGPTFNIAAGSTNALACAPTGCTMPLDVTFSTTVKVNGDLTVGTLAKFKSSGSTTYYAKMQASASQTEDYPIVLPTALPPTVTTWGSSTAYAVGQLIANDSSKTYQAMGAGTSAGSGGPTGTATTGITDGTVTWNYVYASGARRLPLYLTQTTGQVSAVPFAAGTTPAWDDPLSVGSKFSVARTWVALTVSGTGCSAGSPAPAFHNHLGVVYLRGRVIMDGGSPRNCSLTALPAGNRPGANWGNLDAVSISTAGVISGFTTDGTNPLATTGYLDGLTFLAEN